MTEQEFWKIIAKTQIHLSYFDSLRLGLGTVREAALAKQLRRFREQPSEILEFDRIFFGLMDKARAALYEYCVQHLEDMWGYKEPGDNDKFDNFLQWLVMHGEAVYIAACSSPGDLRTLIAQIENPEWFRPLDEPVRGFPEWSSAWYVAMHIYEEITETDFNEALDGNTVPKQIYVIGVGVKVTLRDPANEQELAYEIASYYPSFPHAKRAVGELDRHREQFIQRLETRMKKSLEQKCGSFWEWVSKLRSVQTYPHAAIEFEFRGPIGWTYREGFILYGKDEKVYFP